MTWRPILGLVLAAAAAALGALILGEYEFTGSLPWVAGPLFGLVVGEVAAGVGRSRHLALALLVAAFAFGGIAWAGWIDSTQGLEPVKRLVWVSAALAASTALVRTAGLRGRSSPPER